MLNFFIAGLITILLVTICNLYITRTVRKITKYSVVEQYYLFASNMPLESKIIFNASKDEIENLRLVAKSDPYLKKEFSFITSLVIGVSLMVSVFLVYFPVTILTVSLSALALFSSSVYNKTQRVRKLIAINNYDMLKAINTESIIIPRNSYLNNIRHREMIHADYAYMQIFKRESHA